MCLFLRMLLLVFLLLLAVKLAAVNILDLLIPLCKLLVQLPRILHLHLVSSLLGITDPLLNA